MRHKVTEVELFRTGFAPGRVWTRRWLDQSYKDIDSWQTPELRAIQITQDFSLTPLTVHVRKFVPKEGDMLHKGWVDRTTGARKSVILPPYAFANLSATEQVYMDFINQQGIMFFKNGLDPSNKLVWETYSAAITASDHAVVCFQVF
jgi:hypothetical protein